MSLRRVASVSLVLVALGLAAAFLATRSHKHLGALAVYTLDGPDASVSAVFLVEAFDLNAHRSIRARVLGVMGRARDRVWALPFEQEGENPVVVRVSQSQERWESLRLLARTDLGDLEATVTPSAPAEPVAPDLRALGWPVRLKCGDWQVVMLAEQGVPEVGTAGRVMVLVGGGNEIPAEVLLRLAGSAEAIAPVEPWGGAVIAVEPRVARGMAYLSLRRSEAACEAHFLMVAASRRVRVREMSLREERTLQASVLAQKSSEVFGLVVRRDASGAFGPLLEARVFPVHHGEARVALALPGPGLYQVRFTSEPLQSGVHARGVDALVALDPAVVPEGWLDLVLPDALGPEARKAARPFALATLAAASPVALAQVTNTAQEVRAAAERARGRRDAWLLGGIAFCLVALVLLGGAEVLRAHRQDLGAEEAGLLRTRGGIWVAALVAAILLAAIAAMVLVLKTL